VCPVCAEHRPGTRHMDYFFGARAQSEIAAMSDLQVATVLKKNQIGILSVVAVEVVIFILWLLAAAVPGFALYDGAANTVSAYTHAGWWQLLEFICILTGSVCTFFGFSIYYSSGVVEKGACRVINCVTLYQVVLVLTVLSHVPHVVLSIFEVSGHTSTLATNYVWCLAMTIALLFVLIIVEIVGFCCARVFQKNLCNAIMYGKLDTRLDNGGGSATPIVDTTPDTPPAEVFVPPAVVPSGRQAIMTPLMAKYSSRHGAKLK